MYSTNKIIRTISFAGALVFVILSPTARAVDPPPDGGYPNQNTAEGQDALFSLTTGFSNTAIGYHAFYSDTTGYDSTAIGNDALANNTIGNNNTAIGSDALTANTGGVQNTATGAGALANNTAGYNNTAAGAGALVFNATGNNNTATGLLALQSTTGSNNTGTGVFALLNNTAGSNNIALGDSAGMNLTTGDNNIDIGNAGVAGESSHIRIGTVGTHKRTAIAGISGVTVPGGVGVIIDCNGHLGTVISSERFKDAIKPMDKASEAILALKPVTFHYKKDLDPEGIPQFGLVAEEVEKVNPDLVARDHEGKPYTVRYEAVNAMLLNEFLKEHKKTEKLEATVASLIATMKEQAEQIQKVSAQLEASKPAPQVVNNR
jgi:Chaperone of endosialidase